MATPGISSGVLERAKPLRKKKHVCWRADILSFSTGTSIFTPIFDCVGDGRPLDELEIGTASVVVVPSIHFTITVWTSSGGLRIHVLDIADNGAVDPVCLLWAPSKLVSTSRGMHRYTMHGRRCKFQFERLGMHTETGIAAVAARIEVLNEG